MQQMFIVNNCSPLKWWLFQSALLSFQEMSFIHFFHIDVLLFLLLLSSFVTWISWKIFRFLLLRTVQKLMKHPASQVQTVAKKEETNKPHLISNGGSNLKFHSREENSVVNGTAALCNDTLISRFVDQCKASNGHVSHCNGAISHPNAVTKDPRSKVKVS